MFTQKHVFLDASKFILCLFTKCLVWSSPFLYNKIIVAGEIKVNSQKLHSIF